MSAKRTLTGVLDLEVYCMTLWQIVPFFPGSLKKKSIQEKDPGNWYQCAIESLRENSGFKKGNRF